MQLCAIWFVFCFTPSGLATLRGWPLLGYALLKTRHSGSSSRSIAAIIAITTDSMQMVCCHLVGWTRNILLLPVGPNLIGGKGAMSAAREICSWTVDISVWLPLVHRISSSSSWPRVWPACVCCFPSEVLENGEGCCLCDWNHCGHKCPDQSHPQFRKGGRHPRRGKE